jgi:hypothetical protein
MVVPSPTANLRIIQQATNEVSYLVPTATGMQKSIMDAISPLRTLFRATGYHDYDAQPKGVIRRGQATFVTARSSIPVIVSLYRPRTKAGDPRIWFERLGRFAEAGDTLAVLLSQGGLYVINLSKVDLDDPRSHASAFVSALRASRDSVAHELLAKLRAIARRGCVPAVGHGATSVGRTLEAELGIAINSRRIPDYKGIELKSTRNIPSNRKTLFAQVPTWSLGSMRGSADILANFGYDRGAIAKLYVTVKTTDANPQGLRLMLDDRRDWLVETSANPSIKIVAVWPLDRLRQALKLKHAETFWVNAQEGLDRHGNVCFIYDEVIHTKQPVVTQLEPLIAAGLITVDHLIKRENGRVTEKGPLFKIARHAIPILFPEPQTYSL